MKPVAVWPLLVMVVIQGCAGTRWDGAFRGVEQNIRSGVTRTADAFGLLPPPRMMVARTDVSVRQGPGIQNSRIGVLLRGNEVGVVGSERGWYRIRYGGSHGWVAARLLADPPTTASRRSAIAEQVASVSPETAAKTRRAKPSASVAENDAEDAIVKVAAVSSADGTPIEVAGIPFRWGMTREQASEAYAGAAQRVETSGAIWVRTAALADGTPVPKEWLDLRFCKARLCAIRRVMNAVEEGDGGLGDAAAAELSGRFGAPASDVWRDTAFGRMRIREWSTPSARVQLAHQDDQTYATVEYTPSNASPSNPEMIRGGGPIARR